MATAAAIQAVIVPAQVAVEVVRLLPFLYRAFRGILGFITIDSMRSTILYLQYPTPISLSSPPPLSCRRTLTCLLIKWQRFSSRRRAWGLETAIKLSSSSENPTVMVGPSQSASDVVRAFYQGINDHDLAAVEELIADNCVYEDLIFPRPFVGRTAILQFFKKFNDSISKDLQFVIDDISTEDSLVVGVTWHLDWKGKPFPFSKGCSFYRLQVTNGKRQIIYGRDSVEPAIKPGEAALNIIKGVAWLLQRFPQLADRL